MIRRTDQTGFVEGVVLGHHHRRTVVLHPPHGVRRAVAIAINECIMGTDAHQSALMGILMMYAASLGALFHVHTPTLPSAEVSVDVATQTVRELMPIR